jgi:hypothetical protein
LFLFIYFIAGIQSTKEFESNVLIKFGDGNKKNNFFLKKKEN